MVRKLLSFICFVSLTAPVAGYAQPVDFYVSAGGKYWTDRTIDYSFAATFDEMQPVRAFGPTLGPPSSEINISGSIALENAFGFEAGAGIQLKNLRVGVVVDHFSPETIVTDTSETADVGPFDPLRTQASIIGLPEFEQTGVSLEAGYAYENASVFTPYLLGRVGVSFINYNAIGQAAPGGFQFAPDVASITSISIDDAALRYGGVLGFEVQVADRVRLFAQGEYLRTTNVDAQFNLSFGFDNNCGQSIFRNDVVCLAAIGPPDPQFTPMSGEDSFSFGGFSAAAGFRIKL